MMNLQSDNQVVYKTVFQITIFCAVFSFQRLRKLIIAIVLKICIDMIDSLIFSIFILLESYPANRELAGVAITIGSLAIVAITVAFFCRERKEIFWFLSTLPLRWYFSSIFCCLCAAGLIGYAQDFVMEDGLINDLDKVGFVCAGLLGILFCIMFIMLLKMKKQKEEFQSLSIYNEECLESQAKQFALIGKKDDSLRAFKHDFNAHISMIGYLAQKGRYDELKEYIIEIQQFHRSAQIIKTNNLIVDAILNQYYEMCQKGNIAFSVSGSFPDNITLTQSELCALYSNGMKNAYEAASKCDSIKFIDVKIGTYDDYIDVEIINSIDILPQKNGRWMETTKKDKDRHGIGTRNMANIVEKNGGDIEWQIISEGKFAVHFSWFNR